MKADQLRAAILQQAEQGKLVAQRPNEEPVPNLGTPIDKVPFSIPASWQWVKLGSVLKYGASKQITGDQIQSSTWVLDLEDIEKNTGRLLVKKKGTPSKSNKSVFKRGDVLYSKLRPYLNKVIVADDDGVCTTEIVVIASLPAIKVDALYLQIFLRSPFFVAYANSAAYGVKMPRLGTKDGKDAPFPLPPLAEQKRIVARVNELLALVEQLPAS